MRAAIYYGQGDIRLEDVPDPTLAPGKALVEVEWCGLCGSDLHLYQLGPDVFGNLTKPEIPTDKPHALGHEICGRVRAIPPGSEFKDGDRVIVDPRLPCGDCTVCRSGKEYSCPNQGGVGYSTGGGFAERVAVREKNLYLLPKNLHLDYAVLIEPFAVAVHGIRMTGVMDWRDKSVLVIGAGPLGFALILALKAYKPRKVIVSEPTAVRSEQVTEFADLTLNPMQDDIGQKCRGITDDLGVDIAFGCAGNPAGLAAGLDSLKVEGMYMNLALFEDPMMLPSFLVLSKHITVKNAMVYDAADFKETIKLFSEGGFSGYEKMVTGRISLADIVDKGFRELINRKDNHNKIMVTPRP